MRQLGAALLGAMALLAFLPASVEASNQVQAVQGPSTPAPDMLASRDLEASQLTAQLIQTAEARDSLQSQLQALQAQRDQLQAQVKELNTEVSDLRTGFGAGPGGTPAGSIANHFPWGWCTWYVASRRSVPWFGDAITWLAGASSFGWATGSVPRAGAIMVSAESAAGHVAYVEAVYSDGSFRVSEMNWTAWGVVDSRVVIPGRVPVRGFIY